MNNKSSSYFRYSTYIKPVTKIPVVKNYGPLIFSLLTVSILIFFAIKPTVETILVLQKKLADADEVLQKVTEKANNLSLGKKNYDNMDQSIKSKIILAVPDTIALKSITQILESAAKNHEASISAIQIQPLVIDGQTNNQPKTLAEISFTFNTEGSYQNLIAMLQELKTSSRLISFDNISLSRSAEGTTLLMSLSGKAYYLK